MKYTKLNIKLRLLLVLLAGFFLLSPPIAHAFMVTYLDPLYQSSKFLTLDFPVASLEFDVAGNLYTEDARTWGTGELRPAQIIRLDAATGYSTSSVYTSFQTRGRGINGLDFDDAGSLYVSEFNIDLDSGRIRELDTTSGLVVDRVELPNFRPTGIAAAGLSEILFPGRLFSAPGFGDLYQLDAAGALNINDLDILLADFVGTGIAADQSGNIFASTPSQNLNGLLGNSIYRIDPLTLDLNLFATFDQVVEELNFDAGGNLYALELRSATETPTIIRISPVPEPGTVLLLGAGLVGLAAYRRKANK